MKEVIVIGMIFLKLVKNKNGIINIIKPNRDVKLADHGVASVDKLRKIGTDRIL